MNLLHFSFLVSTSGCSLTGIGGRVGGRTRKSSRALADLDRTGLDPTLLVPLPVNREVILNTAFFSESTKPSAGEKKGEFGLVGSGLCVAEFAEDHGDLVLTVVSALCSNALFLCTSFILVRLPGYTGNFGSDGVSGELLMYSSKSFHISCVVPEGDDVVKDCDIDAGVA